IVGLVAALPLAALARLRPPMWGEALWLFLGAGFGEEIFYRGYIQSRVDHAFGQPRRWLGFEFGVGLLASSLLFGLVHALNTVDYFPGRYDFGWRMGIQSVFSGIFYGLLRSCTFTDRVCSRSGPHEALDEPSDFRAEALRRGEARIFLPYCLAADLSAAVGVR